MVTHDIFSNIFTSNIDKIIFNLIDFDKKNMEFYFNKNSLSDRNWTYAALDDCTFDQESGELDRLIKETENISKYYCMPLDAIKEGIGTFKDTTVYTFNNCLEDWQTILSPSNEFTLWESIIFNQDPFQIFIIKPWSVGYNLLVGSNVNILKKIFTDNGWIFNKKHPIYPP